MAFRFRIPELKNVIFLIVLIITLAFAFPLDAHAGDIPDALPSLNAFIKNVKNGDTDTLRGVYIPNVMAFVVEQQPAGYPGYVSTVESVVTQFSIAAEVGNIGLLAHNTHAGAFFTSIKEGNLIVLVYGDGHTETFMTQSIQRYQALDPLNPYSQFKDLETQTTLTAEGLFNKVYRGDYHLTLQTCIGRNGNASWGRLFIVAFPVENTNLARGDPSRNSKERLYRD